MNKKISYSVIVLIIVALAGYFLYQKNKAGEGQSLPVSDISPSSVTPVEKTAFTAALPMYVWQLTAVEANASDIPRTAVVITVDGALHPVGMYDGSCNVLQAGQTGIGGEQADANEITRIQCYYAGSGDEVGIFIENGKTVVKTAELSEGGEDDAPFRGNWKVVTTL